MTYQSVFSRYELKYMLDSEQKNKVLSYIRPHMALDQYGRTTIRNLYFDTDNYRLIRRSIEKPAYKEKLRIRSYAKADQDSTVFVELKKKYKSIVYKRRVAMSERAALDWLICGKTNTEDTQITREINYFIGYYSTLHPTVFLSYDREAYYSTDGEDLRITFDEGILARDDELSLEADPRGISLLPQGKILMEIKSAVGMPLWLSRFLSKEGIFKTPFSKYGIAYEKLIYPTIWGGNK